MSARRRSSAGLLALFLLVRGAAAQSADPQGSPGRAPGAPTPAMPTTPAMPQVAAPAAPSDDVVATPFGPMSRSSLGSTTPAPAPVPTTRPARTSSASGGTAAGKASDKGTGDKSGKSSSKTSASASATVAAEPPPAPVAPPAVIIAPAAPVAAPAASADAPRPWLRDRPKAEQQAEAKKEEPKRSPWGTLLALLVIAGLGGFAFVARHRRGKTAALPPAQSRIVVLSSAKIGPKANAVVAEVAGKVYLLGVTDSSVSRLAVLDGGPRRSPRSAPRGDRRMELANDVESEDARAALLASRRAPVETADADDVPFPTPAERPLSTKFGEMLDRALGVKSPAGVPDFRGNPAVAALLAGDVEDVVATAPGRREFAAPQRTAARAARPTINAQVVEEQVAGLSRKRRHT